MEEPYDKGLRQWASEAIPPLYSTSRPCLLHTKHVPNSHVNHVHHIWPRGHGGPDTDDNKVVVCATGHYNIHRLLEEYLTYRGEPPYSFGKQFSREERKYARLGYERIVRKAI